MFYFYFEKAFTPPCPPMVTYRLFYLAIEYCVALSEHINHHL